MTLRRDRDCFVCLGSGKVGIAGVGVTNNGIRAGEARPLDRKREGWPRQGMKAAVPGGAQDEPCPQCNGTGLLNGTGEPLRPPAPVPDTLK